MSSPARTVREYLYVDSVKVNGLLGQLLEGVPETATDTDRTNDTTGAGARNYAWRQHDSGNESERQRSLADSNYPELERILESEHVLRDFSELLHDPASWSDEDWREDSPPGSLIKMTLPATLFDSRYVAEQMKSWASTIAGLQLMGVFEGSPTSAKPPHKFPRHPDIPPELDEYIPAVGPFSQGGEKMTREQLQAIVKVSRGIFNPGLHLVMRPPGGGDEAVFARLEEGRRFLDADPDVLFARYGVQPQYWTLVGTVGHYPEEGAGGMPTGGMTRPDGSVSRVLVSEYINGFLNFMAGLGFGELPRFPAFSVVPIAVYREQVVETLSEGRRLRIEM